MKPIVFPGVNIIYAADQPEYLPLPAMRFPNGETIHCWELTAEEIEEINRTGRIFVSQWAFGHKLQPVSVAPDRLALFPPDYEEYNPDDLKLNDRLLLWDGKRKDYFGCTVIVEQEKFVQVSMGEYGVWNIVRGNDYVEMLDFKIMAKIVA